MPNRLRCGVSLAVLAISAPGAWAASTPAPAAATSRHPESAARFVLTAADMTAVFPNPVPPYRVEAEEPVYGRYEPTGLFNAGFRDRQHRAEQCEQLPKIPPSEFYPLTARHNMAQLDNGLFIPARAVQGSLASNRNMDFMNTSFNLYLLCLQGLVH